MNDHVLVNVRSTAVRGRRVVLWPGVPRAGPVVPALFLGSFKCAQIPVTASVCLTENNEHKFYSSCSNSLLHWPLNTNFSLAIT